MQGEVLGQQVATVARLCDTGRHVVQPASVSVEATALSPVSFPNVWTECRQELQVPLARNMETLHGCVY